jgi:Membrane bound FAD containing D-sorbitol dehydrogenase
MSSTSPIAAAPAPPMKSFIDLSAMLTGIAASNLAPSLDPKNLKQLYFNQAQQQAGAAFEKLLSIFNVNAGKPPETIANIIFQQSGNDVCYLARSIMLMWYLGSWYAPCDLQRTNTSTPPPPSVVLSMDAYTQGWAWSVAQAHPMGYSNGSFGYWANTPKFSLTDVTGGTPK